MKTKILVLILILVLLVVSCGPASIPNSALRRIECYSNGVLIYTGVGYFSQDGWAFIEAESGKRVTLAGDCIGEILEPEADGDSA